MYKKYSITPTFIRKTVLPKNNNLISLYQYTDIAEPFRNIINILLHFYKDIYVDITILTAYNYRHEVLTPNRYNIIFFKKHIMKI